MSATDPGNLDVLDVETTRSDDVVRVALRGEADVATLPALHVALEHIGLEGARVVHLDLDGLHFADTAAIRRLADFAREARRTGHDVRTLGASRMIHEVTGLLAVQGDLGLG